MFVVSPFVRVAVASLQCEVCVEGRLMMVSHFSVVVCRAILVGEVDWRQRPELESSPIRDLKSIAFLWG